MKKKQGWTNAFERYELKPLETGTELIVQVETV